jgi:hypothetical protein
MPVNTVGSSLDMSLHTSAVTAIATYIATGSPPSIAPTPSLLLYIVLVKVYTV